MAAAAAAAKQSQASKKMHFEDEEDELMATGVEVELPSVFTTDDSTMMSLLEGGTEQTPTSLPGGSGGPSPSSSSAAYPGNDGLMEDGTSPSNLSSTLTSLPSAIQNYLTRLSATLSGPQLTTTELQSMYETGWNKLSEKYYPKSRWPDAETVAAVIGDDPLFLVLYKELYFRHIYSKLSSSLTIDDRIDSFSNYCDLFNTILNSGDEPCSVLIPNQWLWDIIDEFIYQWQSWSTYRSKGSKGKTEYEIQTLESGADVWNVLNVLNVLYSLVDKSCINQQLIVSKENGSPEELAAAAGEFGSIALYRSLGYFSLIGALRVHCLLGDYVLALKTLEHIDLRKKGLFARVTACHVTTYYYVSFAYMMMRRYADAIRSLSHVLLFVSRTKSWHTRSYQHEVISKKSDQMYAMLCICMSLSPQRLDDHIMTTLREKHGDQLNAIQKSGSSMEELFKDLFYICCPKFVDPAPQLVDGESAHAVPYKHQLSVFLADIKNQATNSVLRSYLKCYSKISVAKLATFLHMTPKQLTSSLILLKQSTCQIRCDSGNLLEGSLMATLADMEFLLEDEETIEVEERKSRRREGEYFIRNIVKFAELSRNMGKGGVAAVTAT